MQFHLFISNTYYNAYEQMIEKLKGKNINEHHFFIVPDRMTLNVEKSIFEKLNIKSTFNIEVITLSKLASLVLSHYENNKKLLTKQSAVMLVTKIILNKKDELKAFQKAVKLRGFCENIFETIMQLKSCNITSQEFKNSYSGDNVALRLKIDDISLIYDEYEKFLSEGYIDSSTKLNLLIEEIGKLEFIKNSHFYFAFFDNFTAQQYGVIEKLVKYSKSVNVGFCASQKEDKNAHIYLTNIYDNLTNIAKIYGMNLKDIIIYSRENLNKEFEIVANNLYSFKKDSITFDGSKIQLIEANTIEEEIEFAISKIKEQVILHNIRYQDINFALSDIETYAPIIEEMLNSYQIPYFIDKSKNLIDHEFVKFILNALISVKNNFSSKDVLSYSKNYFASLNITEQNIFEDYVLKYGVENNKFFDAFTYLEDSVLLNKIEDIRKRIIFPLLGLKSETSTSKIKTYILKLSEFLEKINSLALLEQLEEDYEKEFNIVQKKLTAQVYEKVNKVFFDLNEILGEEEIAFSDFYNLLLEGFNSVKLSTIPISVDSVFVGDASNNNFSKSKILFVVGAVEGMLPLHKSDVGIILDDEIKSINSSVKLEPSINELNKKARFNLFQLLLTPTEKLFVSYPLLDKNHKEQKSSLVINELQKVFFVEENGKKDSAPIYKTNDCFNKNFINEEKKELDKSFYYSHPDVAFYKLIEGLKNQTLENSSMLSSIYEILKGKYGNEKLEHYISLFDYKNTYECLTNAKELFFQNERTKISQIEDYFACPFKHFLDYGLKVKEKERAGIRPLDVGTILHSVAEKFGVMLKENKINTSTNLKVVAIELIDNILLKPSFGNLVNLVENKNLILSLKEEAIRLVEALKNEQQNSDFKISELEYSFGLFDKQTALKLEANKETISFGGVIDRVDFYDNYFRVIDYKTGKSEFNFKELYFGKKIQLFIYASVIKMLTGKIPAGLFYFPIKNEFADEKNIEKHSLYKMEGAFLSDLKIVKAMDKNLSAVYPNSKLVSINLKTERDNITGFNSLSEKNSFENQEFKQIEEYVLNLSKQAINEILNGNIIPSPYEENGIVCDYCKYSAICKFSPHFLNSSRKVNSKITKETIKEALNG